MVNLTEAGAQLAMAEGRAREALIDGCRSDLAAIERLLSGPLERAKIALMNEKPDEAALACSWEVFANANVRFRARFAMYASELADAEQQFIDATCALIGDCDMDVHSARRITLPRMNAEDYRSFNAHCERSPDAIEMWLKQLEVFLRRSLEREAELALRAVIDRGSMSIARTRIALRRASYGKDVML